MSDEYDDEDELEEVEDGDEFIPGTGVYNPPERLETNHWHRRSVEELVYMMDNDCLILNPEYQRDVVWTPDRMTKLINSLMGNFYVPPLIFNVTKITDANGKQQYRRISVDGKQRLSSIRDFVKGRIPCHDDRGYRWFFTDNGDSSRKKRVLPEKQQTKFRNIEFLCAEYSNLERRQEEDLFSRVQLGVPLTPAEKLRASSGPWQEFAIDIERTYPELMNTIDNKRGRSFQLVLQILKQILNADDHYNPKYSAGATTLKGFCDRPTLLDESFKLSARRVFQTYNEILRQYPTTFENHNYARATKFSPIEFVGTAVLIFHHPKRNVLLLSKDILRMRQYVREERRDLRSNTDTYKVLMSFIDNLEIHRGGASVRVVNMKERRAGESVGSSGLNDERPRKRLRETIKKESLNEDFGPFAM